MSGTYRGVIDCLMSETTEFENAFVAYKHIYDTLAAHPGTTLIARQGDVPDFPDGANPPVAQDFCVFRFDTHAFRTHTFYVFFKVGGSAAPIVGVQLIGSNPSGNNGQVFMSGAVGVGGDTNPWQGTTNADGTDTHPTQFWDNPSGGTNVQVVPASNRDGGADGVDKDNGIYAFDQQSPGDMRWHLVVDDDNIHIAFDEPDDGTYEQSVIGTLDPNPGLSWDTTPLYCSYESSGAFDDQESAVTGATQDNINGCVHPDSTQTVHSSFGINVWQIRANITSMHPSKLGSGHDTFPHHVNTLRAGHEGYLGQAQNLRAAWNFPTNDTDTLLEFISIGGGTIAAFHTLFPWDGATAPQSTVLRTGVVFTRVP